VTTNGGLGLGFNYDNAANLTQNGTATLTYGATVGGPHAVSTLHDSSTGLTAQYAYDADGNLSFKASSGPGVNDFESYGYDANEHMTSYSYSRIPGVSASAAYGYDESGARTTRTSTTKLGLAAENVTTVDREFEIDTARSKRKTFVFIDGRRVLSLERPVTTLTPEHQLQFHSDPLGTNRLITDETGAVVQRAFTKPFGDVYKVVDGGGVDVTPSNRVSQYLFTDHHSDVETGLEYFGARYYDPVAGRFVGFDPEQIGASGGTTFDRLSSIPNYFDPYRYAANNPTTLVDPTGRQEEDDPVEEIERSFEEPPMVFDTTITGAAPSAADYFPGTVSPWISFSGLSPLPDSCRVSPLSLTPGEIDVPLPGQEAARATPRITEQGIARIEAHLGRSELNALSEPANAAMLERLRLGSTSPQDINFYMHELKESAIMNRGVDARDAHLETLEWQGIPYKPGYESQLYHPNVIEQFPEYFNPAAHSQP
jgi:RHS repeat-associated protein